MAMHGPQAGRHILRGRGVFQLQSIDLHYEPSKSSQSRAEIRPILAHQDLTFARSDLSAGRLVFRPRDEQIGRHYAVVISQSAGLSVSRDGVVHQIKSGDAVVLRGSEEAQIDGKSAFRISVFLLPSDGLNTSGIDIESALDRGISRHAEGLVLLRRYVQAIEEDARDSRSLEASAIIARHIRDLLLLALARRPGDFDGNIKLTLLETRLDAVTSYLESNFRNPTTSISEAAAALAISPRYVERLLQGTGTTFIERLMEMRLDEAYRQLRDPQLGDRGIEAISISSGFTNASHFTRRFRARFGYPPSEVGKLTAQPVPSEAIPHNVPGSRRKLNEPKIARSTYLDQELAAEVRKACVAGQHALAASALKEAVSQFRIALDTLRRLPPHTGRDELELECQLGMVSALVAHRGYTDPQTAGAYRRAETLCRVLNLEPRLANVEDAQFREHLVRADYTSALRVCEQSQRGGRDIWLTGAAIVRMHQGKLDAAGDLLDRAIPRRVGRAERDEALTPANYFDTLGRLVYEALYEMLRGNREASRLLMQKSLEIARNSENPAALGFTLSSCTRTSWLDSDGQHDDRKANLVVAQELAGLCRNNSFAYWGAVADCHLAWHAARAGKPNAEVMVNNGLERYRRTGARWLLPYFIALQAEIDLIGGRYERALLRASEARALAVELGEHWYDAGLLSLESNIHAASGRAGDSQRAWQQSRALARKQGASLFLLYG